MKEAWELDQFHRAVQDELVWIKEAETLLSNEDIGKDLQGVRFLLKNHQVCTLSSLSHSPLSLPPYFSNSNSKLT